MTLLACVPVLWVFANSDWNNEHAELVCWLSGPVGLLTIPTLGLVADFRLCPYRGIGLYLLKTAIEWMLIPVWFIAWVVIECLLGFYWI